MITIERPNNLEDFKQISILHKNYLKTGFISSLGEKFLITLYNHINNFPSSFCFVVKNNDKVIGFISGAENLSKLYKSFIKNNLFRVY